MTNTNSKGKSVNRMLAHMHKLMRKPCAGAERGSMDGGTLSDIEYIPFLVGLLLFGLMVALVGFYRVGASYSTQFAAQVGSVAPEQGNAALDTMWTSWTSGNAPTDGFMLDDSNRTVTTRISTSKSFNLGVLGSYSFDIASGSANQVRQERFYPGP